MPKKSLQPAKENLTNETRITFRIDLSNGKAIGPGKIKLLELIEELGSISSAGKAMKMSYRRAWLLIDELNHTFSTPLVTAKQGGKGGGNAEITMAGKKLIKQYRTIEVEAKKTFSEQIKKIEQEL